MLEQKSPQREMAGEPFQALYGASASRIPAQASVHSVYFSQVLECWVNGLPGLPSPIKAPDHPDTGSHCCVVLLAPHSPFASAMV